jgi:transcriptional regulator of arginine metabolism
VLEEFLLDVRLAQNLLILKTSAGNANSLAVALDQEDWPEVAGTVAGDDTIFVACWDEQRAKAVQERLLAFVNN